MDFKNMVLNTAPISSAITLHGDCDGCISTVLPNCVSSEWFNEAMKKIKSGSKGINKTGPDFGYTYIPSKYRVKKIIYNPPATIVFWEDGSKTVVKCAEGEEFSKYFGFCAALAKQVYGNNNRVIKIVDNGETQKDETKKSCDNCGKCQKGKKSCKSK